MKKLSIIAISSITIACTTQNEEKTIEFINNSKKPIICNYYGENGFSHKKYTLISADSKVFNTGNVSLILPDTIK